MTDRELIIELKKLTWLLQKGEDSHILSTKNRIIEGLKTASERLQKPRDFSTNE